MGGAPCAGSSPPHSDPAPRQEDEQCSGFIGKLLALALLAPSPCALVSSDLIIKGSHVISIYGSGVVRGEEAGSP